MNIHGQGSPRHVHLRIVSAPPFLHDCESRRDLCQPVSRHHDSRLPAVDVENGPNQVKDLDRNPLVNHSRPTLPSFANREQYYHRDDAEVLGRCRRQPFDGFLRVSQDLRSSHPSAWVMNVFV